MHRVIDETWVLAVEVQVAEDGWQRQSPQQEGSCNIPRCKEGKSGEESTRATGESYGRVSLQHNGLLSLWFCLKIRSRIDLFRQIIYYVFY